MLDSSKTIYGPFNLIIDDGVSGSAGAFSNTDGSAGYLVEGLQNDAITINETVDKEELEDGVERNLQRVLEINASFSEVNESDISMIQGYGNALNHLVIQFPNSAREIKVKDKDVQGDPHIVYTAELDDSNLSITAQKSSTDVSTANFETGSLTTGYTP